MSIDLSQLPSLSPTTKAFIEADPQLLELIPSQHSYRNLKEAIKGKEAFQYRETLYRVLKTQYAEFPNGNIHPEVLQNIELLKDSNTYTVSTGQQLHPLIGPAFVIYKILNTVRETQNFKQEFPDLNFIPVYWLASEDHDFDEISTVSLFGRSFNWICDEKGPCGRMSTEGVSKMLAGIEKEVQVSPEQAEILNFFIKTYQECKNLSLATRVVIDHFFSRYGVVCIDADNQELKKLFAKTMEKDILENVNKDVVDQMNEGLKGIGLTTQLHVREINHFYMDSNGRNRIEYQDGSYVVLNTTTKWTRDEIKAELHQHPERFSPNAAMRPLYQETILPNCSYIGGNAEVNYWIQIANTFKINDLTAPTLNLRASVWIIPGKQVSKLEKSGIRADQLLLCKSSDEILPLLNETPLDIRPEIEQFNALHKKLQDLVHELLPNELKETVGEGKRMDKFYKRLQNRLFDAQKSSKALEIERLEQIRVNYLNINSIQERKTESAEMLIKYGYPFIDLTFSKILSSKKAYFIYL